MSESVLDLYPDNNGNGIPDAFENRPSISEILHDEFGDTTQDLSEAPTEETVFILRSQLALLQRRYDALAVSLRDSENKLERKRSELEEALNKVSILSSLPSGGNNGTINVEIEKCIRSANAGEWVLTAQGPERCLGYDHNRYLGYVIRRFIKGPEL